MVIGERLLKDLPALRLSVLLDQLDHACWNPHGTVPDMILTVGLLATFPQRERPFCRGGRRASRGRPSLHPRFSFMPTGARDENPSFGRETAGDDDPTETNSNALGEHMSENAGASRDDFYPRSTTEWVAETIDNRLPYAMDRGLRVGSTPVGDSPCSIPAVIRRGLCP